MFRQLIGALALLAALPAQADYDTGSRLYEDCKSEDQFIRGYCGGYVVGVVATMVNLQRFRVLPDSALCIPQDVSKAQLVDAVVKYLDAYPRQRERQAVNLVPDALNAEFPCPRQVLPAAADAMTEERNSLVVELERRIHEMEQHAEEAFGAFNTLDWWLCVLAGVVVPVFLLALFWP